jgi:Glycosyltransferase family 87
MRGRRQSHGSPVRDKTCRAKPKSRCRLHGSVGKARRCGSENLGVIRRLQPSRPIDIVLFAQVPTIVVALFAWGAIGHVARGDFLIFRHAGNALLHGHSPYVDPTVKLLAANDRFVYPTPAALPFIPFAVVPAKLSMVLFFVLSVAAIVASLWLFDVRDWRCYGVALVGMPVLSSLLIGTIGPFLLLLCAAGWRLRHRSVAGMPLALAAGAKLFLWPLLVWLLVTRRFRAFTVALLTIAATLLIWAVVDMGGLRRYPQTIHVLNLVQRWKSYSFQSLLISLHASGRLSEIAAGFLALAASAALVLLRRRSDATTFALAIVAALIATPILWMHYLILLLAPIAVTRPRLSPLWLLPLVLFGVPHPESLGVVWRIVLVLAVLASAGLRTIDVADTIENGAAEMSRTPAAVDQVA